MCKRGFGFVGALLCASYVEKSLNSELPVGMSRKFPSVCMDAGCITYQIYFYTLNVAQNGPAHLTPCVFFYCLHVHNAYEPDGVNAAYKASD